MIGEAEGSFLKHVEVEDVKMGDVSVLKVNMPLPALQGINVPNQGELDELIEKLYGPGGITMYLAAADDDTVLIAYTDMAILRKTLQVASDETKTLAQQQTIVSTSKHLPLGAHAVGYWSPSGTIAFVNRMMKLMTGPQTDVQLPDFPDAPPVGWAMTATPSVLKFTTVVPAETIEATGGFVRIAKRLDGSTDKE